MNILLVYPAYPDTYWSFRHALRFVSKKAAVPPLGLITVSAMLPASWNKRLVDMNVAPLEEKDLVWADYVFLSAMYVQKESVNWVIGECIRTHTKIVAGGPLFTKEHENYPQIDHFILNEAEITLPRFLLDIESGIVPDRIYSTEHYADMATSPVPDFHLLRMKDYANMSIQVSRGCPYSCDFCEISSLLGRKVRMKSARQVIRELDTLYRLHWRGAVTIVDDNFIGNKMEAKYSLLPAMHAWMEAHRFPFSFTIQSSINLADDDELLSLSVRTGINTAFIGIESPVQESLEDCHKVQNQHRDMLQSVRKIQGEGIQVSGGFIVGFDSDSPGVFKAQVDFIQESGIVAAMVGLLNAPKNTRLYQQLAEQKRLTAEPTGSNTDYSMNFEPRMGRMELLQGYKSIIRNIYSIKPYYKRIRNFLLTYRKYSPVRQKIEFNYLLAFVKSVFIIGILNKGRSNYWKLIFWTLYKNPAAVMDAITLAVYGYHFRKVYRVQT